MIVTAVRQTILIPQNGLTFFGVQGGGLPPPQTLNAGQGQMSWSTSVVRRNRGGAGCVSDRWRDGRVTGERAAADSSERVSGHLSAGALLRIRESDVAGSERQPAICVGDFKPVAAGSNVGPLAQPTGMIFVKAANGESPSSQTVRLQTSTHRRSHSRTGISITGWKMVDGATTGWNAERGTTG